jgi:glycosyltransferase involved in cell wall biosynthesis
MTTTPKVSILIPNYNYARYLPEAIESILAQDFTDFELLISDDCSTDNSAEVIARYAAQDKRIRFQIHSANLGMVHNLNWCLSQARGEFVKIICGDDKLASPNAISQMVSLIESDPAISLIASASIVIDDRSRVIDARNNFARGVHDGKKTIVRCLERPPNPIGEPTVTMFRKRQGARGFDARYRQIVDLEMWLHLLEDGKFGYLDEPLCAFRRHALQQTNANRESGQTDDEILRLVDEYATRPWLERMSARWIMFAQLHWLRNSPSARTSRAFGKVMAKLGAAWFAACWLRHKITRPFLNMQSSFKKRRTFPK